MWQCRKKGKRAMRKKGTKKRIKRNEIRTEELAAVLTVTFAVLS
jgi:hypothetical protein